MRYISRFATALPPHSRVLGGLTLAVLALSSCNDTQPPVREVEYTVNVEDTNYGLKFNYVTTRQFQYAYTALPDYPESPEEAQMLALVNAERAKGGVCHLHDGNIRIFDPASPLKFEGHLHKAATLYAEELAAIGSMQLSHRSPRTNLTPSQRIVEAGYKPLPPDKTSMLFQESLAAELEKSSPEDVINAWKASPDHCIALYEPLQNFSHGSVARVESQIDGKLAVFWVLNTAGY